MQCPSCSKTGFVTIGNKRYCSNCGAKLPDSSTTMSDIRPSVNTAPKPAATFHGTQVGSSPAVLDLRGSEAQASQPAVSKPAVAPQAAPAAATPPAPSLPKPAPSPPPSPAPQPAPAPVAAAPLPVPPLPPAPKPVAISAPPLPVTMPATPDPTPDAQPSAAAALTPPMATPAASTTAPVFKKFPTHPALQEPTPAAQPPNLLDNHIETLRRLADQAGDGVEATPKSAELAQAMAAAKPRAFTPAKVTAIAAVVAVMGGLVWMQNSTKMAFNSAASKAGFQASLPTYVPSSYHQSGPASAAQGRLTIAYTAPDNSQPLSITQRPSTWDSNSLRDNYVVHQTDSYLAAEGQGLTLYIWENQATWVNHGVWYVVTGTSNLSREQILKVAYGL